MKIFAVINNYKAEDAEAPPQETGWYELPDSAILRSGNPFFVPDFDTEFRVFPTLCLRLGRLGKSIKPRFAPRYIDAWTMGASVIAMDRLRHLRSEGLPWSRAVAFDRCCLLGNLQPINTLIEYKAFQTECCGQTLEYRPEALINPAESLISMISEDNTVKTGDLLLAGLHPCGIRLTPDSRLNIFTDNLTLLGINIK